MPRTLRLTLALLVLLPGAAWADRAQTFIGSTAVGGTYQRATADGSSLSGQPGPMRFIAQEFKVTSTTTCSISSSQDFDGVIFIYRNSFDPTHPLTNFLGGGDDGPIGSQPSNIGSSLIEDKILDGVPSGGGRTFVLVTTGFDSTEFGSFQNFIQCDNDVQPVQGSCSFYSGIPPENAICLADRFLVAITQVSGSPTGIATPVRTGSTDTGLFWFYNDRNWEVMVKVVNGCGINNRWWFFAGSLTNQHYRISILDTKSGGPSKFYDNTLGVNAPAIADTNAFATCP